MTNLYEDDYPEGIEAFDPVPDTRFTLAELAIILVATAVTTFVGYWWLLPGLRSAATAALLLASAR